jgi:hypothetical protein
MSDQRAAVDAALRSIVVPALRKAGFKGSLPHFRRIGEDKIDLLTFQFDKYGGGFVVEIAMCEPGGFVMPWGDVIPPAKVTAHHIASPRPRLGPAGIGQDHWFRFDTGVSPDDLANEVATLVRLHAEAWWRDG